ncbi:NHL domain-containing protein [Mucilaginibacter segetis]|uniref:Gliding motility-associated C-terminal domain-containing protein n=1 Tax=Mucilaginibacter segetis TaxID=2793071 RepID=A0A934PVK2_9SPHI|nr:gliding motility-associated C-terminal domain-containing protein [Mucilaginibacter segetis]MBK0379895.1 gliding motility-associated C-terminal domain-containing protein [Mucilaginibacter segetis]
MKRALNIIVFLLHVIGISDIYAQSPVISYPSPQSYMVGTAISPLVPENTGGAVPPNIFADVTTFAGNGTTGKANGPRTQASFNAPHDIKIDAAGNLYIADAGNNLIRKITPDGIVSTVAGTGIAGFADGPVATATFNTPKGITVDKNGNIFVADTKNHLIRKIDVNGIVSTLAGNPGVSGASNSHGSFATFNLPTGIAASDIGWLFVADYGNQMVRLVAPDGNVSTLAGNGTKSWIDGKGDAATFISPNAITVGSDGIIYMADNSHIRTIDIDGNVITIAGSFFNGNYDGTGKASRFDIPAGIVRDGAGVLFIGDQNNNYIRRMDPVGAVNTIAGSTRGSTNGVGTAATFNAPAGVAIDAEGNLYIADEGNNLIRKVVTTGYSISPELPPGLIFDSKTGIISGTPTATIQANNYSITAYNTAGRSVTTVSIEVRSANLLSQKITFGPLPNKTTGDLDFDPGATTSNPTIPITYTSSDLSVASIANGKIHIVGAGIVTITAIQMGNINYKEAEPASQQLTVIQGPDLKKPGVTPKPGPLTLPLDQFGSYTIKLDDIATITPGENTPPLSIKIKPAIVDCSNLGLQTIKVSAGYGPDPADPLNSEFNYPSGLSYDALTGNIYISDLGNFRVRKFSPEGRVTTLAGNGIIGSSDGTSLNASFSRDLLSLANDDSGNTFVCDVLNMLVRKITPDGLVSTFATNALKAANSGSFFVVQSIAIDRFNNIFVADKSRILKVTPDGKTVTVFAGNSLQKNVDGVGVAAGFSGIFGLAFDKNGNLLVSTSDNDYANTIRKITPLGVVTTVFQTTASALRFSSLVVDSNGNIFVASASHKIYKVTANGDFSIFAGNTSGYADGKGAAAKFNNPIGITIDGNDNLYIADTDNQLIRMITPQGIVTTIAGNHQAGFFDNAAESNATTKEVHVNIISPVKFISTYSDVSIPVAAACPATLPDYTKDAAASSTCANNIQFMQSPAAGTMLATDQPVNVTLTATDNLNQTATATFSVTAILVKPPSVKITQQSGSLCEGSPVTYIAESENAGKTPTYQWKINGVNRYSGGPSFLVTSINNGDKISCIVTNNDACTPVASTPSNIITANAAANISASLQITSSVSQAICPGVEVTFTAIPANLQSTTAASFQWKVNGQNVGTNNAEFTTNRLASGDLVTCVMTVSEKCIANPVTPSNIITVNVRSDLECAIKINNTFTPNGDGVNDYWEIPELSNYPNCDFYIYNRYGKVVYHSIGYTKAWDGNYKGKLLTAGTYYYVINLKNGGTPLSGPLTILR